jgi:hypothetical protein
VSAMTKTECRVAGCASLGAARGLCQRHRRYALQGRPLTAERLIYSRLSEDDFWARVAKSAGCWEWTQALTSAGYGKVQLPTGKTGSAHRRAYELTHGPIPDGLVIDHLCRNKRCVRPDHLEAVTVARNTQRGLSSFDLTGMCRSGRHPMESGDDYRIRRGRVRNCVHCTREGNERRRDLIKRAAVSLGLSANQYRKQYGLSIAAAGEVLGER